MYLISESGSLEYFPDNGLGFFFTFFGMPCNFTLNGSILFSIIVMNWAGFQFYCSIPKATNSPRLEGSVLLSVCTSPSGFQRLLHMLATGGLCLQVHFPAAAHDCYSLFPGARLKVRASGVLRFSGPASVLGRPL